MLSIYYVKDLFNAPRRAPESIDLTSYTKVVDLDTDDLEVAFREMNAVDGTETCCKLRVRSMSVGDVAVDSDGVASYCCSMGWATTKIAK